MQTAKELNQVSSLNMFYIAAAPPLNKKVKSVAIG